MPPPFHPLDSEPAGDPDGAAWKGYAEFQFIAKGGAGSVYKARDLQLKRWVALKFLNQEGGLGISRLLREARAQARVDHPHVLKVYEVGEKDGQPFIAMQLVQGGTLSQMLLLFTLEQRIRIVMQTAMGLHAAHTMGLLHLDIKPGNILVELTSQDEPWPYLTDFGLVRLDAAGPMGRAGGTLNYASPEQMSPGWMRLDRRSDVFSLGATLYFALSGRSPFDGAEPQSGPLREIIPLGQRDGQMPLDLQAITEKCLRQDPADRYPSAKAVADELGRYLEGVPVEARHPTLRYRLGKWFRRNRRLAAFAAAAALLLAGLGVASLAALQRKAAQARLADRFGREVQEMEQLLRLAHLARKHDRRPTVALMRQTMRAIEQEMGALGSGATGPGSFALGRGHASLNEWAEALVQLDRAWNAGFRTPACAQTRGETLAALFLEAAKGIGSAGAEARQKALAGLQARYRDPALECFAIAAKGGLHSPYQGAWEAYLKGDEARALVLAEEASRQSPWFYEADALRCAILRAQGRALFMAGQDREAAVLLDVQSGILDRLLDLAPSDPKNWLRKGWVDLFHYYVHRGAGISWLERAKADMETSIAVDPDLAEGYQELSDICGVLAMAQRERDPLPMLDRGVEFARLGQAHHPGGRSALGLGLALLRRGDVRLDLGQDPGTDFDLALQVLQGLVGEGLPGGEAQFRLANAYAGKARQAFAMGEDPVPFARQSAHWSRLGDAFEPGNLSRRMLALSQELDCAEWEARCRSGFSIPPKELVAEAEALLKGLSADNPLVPELWRHQARALGLVAQERVAQERVAQERVAQGRVAAGAGAGWEAALRTLQWAIKEDPEAFPDRQYAMQAKVALAWAQDRMRRGADAQAQLCLGLEAARKDRRLHPRLAENAYLETVISIHLARSRRDAEAAGEGERRLRRLKARYPLEARSIDALMGDGPFPGARNPAVQNPGVQNPSVQNPRE